MKDAKPELTTTESDLTSIATAADAGTTASNEIEAEAGTVSVYYLIQK